MEKMGLQRSLEALADKAEVVELVTDASTSIAAMMGELKYRHIKHLLDV
jgi:ribonuclease HI